MVIALSTAVPTHLPNVLRTAMQRRSVVNSARTVQRVAHWAFVALTSAFAALPTSSVDLRHCRVFPLLVKVTAISFRVGNVTKASQSDVWLTLTRRISADVLANQSGLVV